MNLRGLPRYPSRYEQVLSALCESMEALDEPEAKASMIWILGEYVSWLIWIHGDGWKINGNLCVVGM